MSRRFKKSGGEERERKGKEGGRDGNERDEGFGFRVGLVRRASPACGRLGRRLGCLGVTEGS